ncbi:MAG: hypothetical protein OXH02_07005 [Gemmatimonadetes bacterium]|nr:hypothetical protein [Gemmatimonadota bacterium]
MSDLQGGQSHPAGGVVNENAVSSGNPAPYHEPQVRRQKSHGQRGGLLDAQMLRPADNQVCLRGDVSGHGRRHHPHDHVAHFHGVHLVAVCEHFADAFPSKGRLVP